MKKLTIGLLIILPIIIVMVVSLVSVIISGKAYIGVEEVKLDKRIVEIAFDDCVYDLDDLLKVEILPEKATHREYTWTIENGRYNDQETQNEYEKYVNNPDEYAGEIFNPCVSLIDENGKVVDENESGQFVVNGYGSFDAVVHAEQISARCTVCVVGYEVEKVDVIVATELTVGEIALADVVYNPVDSIVDETIWTVEDESILTIDKNGVIKALKEGKTNVTMKAKVYEKDEYVESAPVEITVSKGATVFGDVIKTVSNSVELSALELVTDDVSDLENCILDGNTVKISNSSLPAYFMVSGKKVTINVVDENAIEIENAKVFAFDETKDDNFILAAGDKLYLNAILSDTFAIDKNANVEWTTNAPAVASVDENGVVSGIKSGIVTITATSASGKSASIVVRVEKKVITLLLETTTKSLEVGLAKQTVFASKEYADKNNPSKENLVNNTFAIEFLRPYIESDDMYDAFTFEVFENGEVSNKAHFEKNVLVFDRENITEMTKLTLKISAKYPKYKSYSQNTTCLIDLYVTDAIGVNSCKEFEQVGKDGFAACLESNIKLFDGAETTTIDSTVIMQANVYGNGYMFSAYKQQITSSMILVRASNVTVSNIVVRANEVGEEITTADETEGLKGTCVAFDSSKNYIDHYENCRVEYCICENASSCIRSINADLTIEGCIIRNSQGTGVYVPTRMNYKDPNTGEVDYTKVQYSNITIRNCVMSNLIGTGFSFYYDKFTDTEDKIPYAQKYVAEGKGTTLYQEGFLDIYNWQASTVLSLIDPGSVPDEFESVIGIVNAVLGSRVEEEIFRPYRSEYNGQKYLHLGLVSTGFTETSYLTANFEDDRFMEITSDNFDIGIKLPHPIRIFTYGNHDEKISPASTYAVNSKLIERLHGNY